MTLTHFDNWLHAWKPFLRGWPNSLEWRHGLVGDKHRLIRCLSVTLIGLALA